MVKVNINKDHSPKERKKPTKRQSEIIKNMPKSVGKVTATKVKTPSMFKRYKFDD